MNKKRILCLVLALILLVPEAALGSGYTGGAGAYGVYLIDDEIHQAWYETSVVEDGAFYIVGVYGTYVYYQTKPVDGVSSLRRSPLYLVSDEYILAESTLELTVVASGSIQQAAREASVISENVVGRAVLDETAGCLYYVESSDLSMVMMAVEYPSFGLTTRQLYAASSAIRELRLTVNGLAMRTENGCLLYLTMMGQAITISEEVFGSYKQSALYNGHEVLLGDDGNLSFRLDAVSNEMLSINDSVLEFTVYGDYVYYLRRTRWRTEINQFDPVTRSSKVIYRTLEEMMPQIVSAGDFLYIMDAEYTVYRVSPTSGKYAVYMKLKQTYEGYDAVQPRLLGAGEELLVYDQPKSGSTDELSYVYSQFVGSTEHPTLPPEGAAQPGEVPTATPTAVPAYYPTMSRGSRGDNVKLMQQKLIELGYLDDTADGVFGGKTQTAIEDLQADLGIEVTGIMDNDLMNKLVNGEIPAYDLYKELKRGDKGKRVSTLQSRLKALGYLAGPVDGTYGAATQNAVTLFQNQQGFPQTGTADSDTLRALYADDAPKATSYIELKYGDSGYRVAELVDRLIELYYLPSSARGSVYNTTVQDAVKAYQKEMGFWQNGKASRYLQGTLFSESASEYSGYTMLRYGDINERVRDMQWRLYQLGYQTGNIDGNYGTRTQSAIRAFQTQAGLTVTGTADAVTLEKLYSSAAPAYPTPTPALTPTIEPFIYYEGGLTVRVNSSYSLILEAPES
ncbi:MAG: peptidoglycan-binding protein, partial [Clostridia bacterium]|nr:peptidoglycan-binding protein [Clostridia bacterium]